MRARICGARRDPATRGTRRSHELRALAHRSATARSRTCSGRRSSGAWPASPRAAARLRREGGPGGRRPRPPGPTRTRRSRPRCAGSSTAASTTRRSARCSMRFVAARRSRPGGRNSLAAKLLQLTGPGRARCVPGQRTVGDLARRPRQPPPGRLRACGASCLAAARRRLAAADRRDRRGQAAGHLAGAAAPPGPAGLFTRYAPVDGRSGPRPATRSRSIVAAPSRWRPACPSASQAARRLARHGASRLPGDRSSTCSPGERYPGGQRAARRPARRLSRGAARPRRRTPTIS